MGVKKKDVLYGIVAFIDLLGFSQKVKTAKLLKNFKKIIQQVQLFRDEFNEKPEALKPAKKEIIAFADCVIISIAAKSELSLLQGTYDTWLSDLSLLAISQINCILKTNVFLRGGVSAGWWYHKDNLIISPAQVEAYELEKEKAHYPIIVLSDQLAKYFKDPECYKAYSSDPTTRLLRKDEERNTWFIDYLGHGVEEVSWMGDESIVKKYKQCHDGDKRAHLMAEGWKTNAKAVFKRHKKAILKAYCSSPTNSIKKKYIWLAKYHNDVIGRYGNHFEDCKIDKIERGH
jgi:hypothetical protein